MAQKNPTRETRVPVDTIPPGWEIDGDPFVIADDDQDQLEDAMAAAVHIMRYIGGAITQIAVRREIAPGVHVTVEHVFRWYSYAPSLPGYEAEAQEQPEPVEESVPEPAAA